MFDQMKTLHLQLFIIIINITLPRNTGFVHILLHFCADCYSLLHMSISLDLIHVTLPFGETFYQVCMQVLPYDSSFDPWYLSEDI